MRSCRVASVVSMVPFAVAACFSACRAAPAPEVPPVTTAPATSAITIISTPANAPDNPPRDVVSTNIAADAAAPVAPAPEVRVVEGTSKLADGLCATTLFAVAKGSFTVMKEKLSAGDVLVVRHAVESPIEGTGLAVEARTKVAPCAVLDRPAPVVTVVRGHSAPPLTWAKGTMTARLDVDPRFSAELYLGRLEGTAAVAEHAHPASWEILVASEAAGTFTIDGRASRLAPRQIVMVPPGAKHAWKPDAGSKLVAIQMYAPPGPEERFVALAAAERAERTEKDGGTKAASAPDASAR